MKHFNELSNLSTDFGSQNKMSQYLDSSKTIDVLDELSANLSCKIFVKNPETELSDGKYADLSVVKIEKDEYEQKVVNVDLCDNVLYLLSADYIDAYGQQICAVTMDKGMYEGIAATKPYVDELSDNFDSKYCQKTAFAGLSSNAAIMAFINTLNTQDGIDKIEIQAAVSALYHLLTALTSIN